MRLRKAFPFEVAFSHSDEQGSFAKFESDKNNTTYGEIKNEGLTSEEPKRIDGHLNSKCDFNMQ